MAGSTVGTVLVVDDNEDVRESLAMLLREGGYRVETAVNGQEALQRLRSGAPPALILLDLMMPVMDGWELQAELEEDPELSSIPVVVMSASGRARHDALQMGADGCLAKPFHVGVLLDTVDRHCQPEGRPRPGSRIAA